MPVDSVWNGMTAHIIIKQAQIGGIKNDTVHEVFNEIMKDSGYTSNKGGYASGERIDTLFKIQVSDKTTSHTHAARSIVECVQP